MKILIAGICGFVGSALAPELKHLLDSARVAAEWNWRPATKLESTLDEIARRAEQHPERLDLSEGT